MESYAFAEPLAGDGDCPPAISKRDSITTMNTAANFISLWSIPHVANLYARISMIFENIFKIIDSA